MKNCFGITPCTIYGDGAPKDEPGLVPLGGRFPIHTGSRQPPKSSLPEINPASPREGGYRVPRCVADLVAARPIHLAIIDGVESQTTVETVSRNATYVKPHLLVAGTNAVCVDAVGAAVMGFDPMADRGSRPFERCDSTLRLAEELGVGTRDLKRIEVIGGRISDLAVRLPQSRRFAAGDTTQGLSCTGRLVSPPPGWDSGRQPAGSRPSESGKGLAAEERKQSAGKRPSGRME